MITLIRWIVSTIATITIIAFAVANRGNVSITWSPIHEQTELPVFLIGLVGMGFGFIVGGFMVWLNGSARRREMRKLKKTVKKLEKILGTSDKEIPKIGTINTNKPQHDIENYEDDS